MADVERSDLFTGLSRVLVLGGSGFIGSHLLSALARAGVTTLVSLDLRVPADPIEGVRYLQGDVREPLAPQIPEASSGFDVIFNLAAIHVTPGHPDHAYYDTNVLGALHATRLARETGVGRIVFTSSISTYGPREETCDETTALKPVSAYGKSKRMAELIHQDWRNEMPDRRIVIARPAVVFGPGERGNFTRLIKAIRRGLFVYPGRTDTIKACGYVDDLVASFSFALDRNDGEFLYNFAMPTRVAISDICGRALAIWGGTAPRGVLPLGPLHAVARLFEVANALGFRNGINRARVDKLTLSTDVQPAVLERAGFRFPHDLSSALTDWRDRDPDLSWSVGR
jgi:nucleoside-diphosphate-sugar epimerase